MGENKKNVFSEIFRRENIIYVSFKIWEGKKIRRDYVISCDKNILICYIYIYIYREREREEVSTRIVTK